MIGVRVRNEPLSLPKFFSSAAHRARIVRYFISPPKYTHNIEKRRGRNFSREYSNGVFHEIAEAGPPVALKVQSL